MRPLGLLTLFLLFATSAIAQDTRTEDTREVRAEKDSADAHVVMTHYSRTTDVVTELNDVLTINPVKFFVFYNLDYLHIITPHIAVGGGFQVPTVREYSGIGFNLEGRWYPGPHLLRGGYLSPTLGFNFNKVRDGGYYYDVSGNYVPNGGSSKVTTVTAGLVLGWQWFWSDAFAVGLGLGFDFPIVQSASSYRIPFLNTSDGAESVFRVDLGYGW